MSDPALEIEGLVVDYGRGAVLDGIDLVVDEQEITCLLGANGAGKTTTVRAISGMLDFHRGTIRAGDIRLFGESIVGLSSAQIVGRGLATVPEGRRIFADLTVEDNLRVGASQRKDREVEQDVDLMIGRFPQLQRPNVPAGYLSGGEQQMLAIGRALMSRPRIVLLDEPSLGLAPKLADYVMDVVADIRQQGTSILLVEQNVDRGLSVSDTGSLLEMGRVVMAGPSADILADDRVRAAYLGIGPDVAAVDGEASG